MGDQGRMSPNHDARPTGLRWAGLLWTGYLLWTLPHFVTQYWPTLRGFVGSH